ncbi:MAG: hypothetical protein GX841_05675, partial [Bacteroidales bacterium]|nr:hypothetical protein [Bacteroidales bacterium]
KYLFCLMFTGMLCLSLFQLEAQSARKVNKGLYKSAASYEVQVLGVGQDGTKVFRIWSYDKTVEAAINKAKRDAVAACLFSGLPGSGQTNQTPAICKSGDEETHEAFFQEFFAYPDKKGNGGAYLRFVNRTTDEPPSGKYRVQMKGGYKIAIDVQVLYNNLRSYMEEKGIVKKLGHGF